MFFHVVIKSKMHSKKWCCIFRDLSLKELKRRFIKPYKLNEKFLSEGKLYSFDEISEIVIVRTEELHRSVLTKAKEESRKRMKEANSNSIGIMIRVPSGVHDFEIKDYGDNVTSEFIQVGPGSGTNLSKLRLFLKNPWLVRIVGGLIVAGIMLYFGLK